jgi:hypothetical protein
MPRGPLADSYMRLSSLRHKDGDSLRRQTEPRDRWLSRHPGILLSETFADIGVSGFRGKHRMKGALSRYLEHIRAGEVIRGDFFLVEDMDRITREPVSDALKLVISILEAGVTICVLNTDWSITLESFNRDASHVFMLAAAIRRQRGEPSKVRNAHQIRRAEAEMQRAGQQASERARAPANVARLMAEMECVTGRDPLHPAGEDRGSPSNLNRQGQLRCRTTGGSGQRVRLQNPCDRCGRVEVDRRNLQHRRSERVGSRALRSRARGA